MEDVDIPFLDELRRQILVAARDGRDRQGRASGAWAARHALLLASVAALVVASGLGAALLTRTHAGNRHGLSSTTRAAAPSSQALGPAHSAGAFGGPPPTIGDRLFSIAAAGPNDIWAVGQRQFVTNGVPSGASLIEHWEGRQWTVVSCPNISVLVSVTAIGANDVWAIAQGTGLGRQALHWGGSAWQVVAGGSLLRSHGSGRVTLIAGRPSDVWAIGWGRASAGSKWGPLAVRWDGVSWNRVPSPGVLAKKHHSTPVSLAVLGPNDVWAVGSRNIVLRSSHHKARRPFVEHWNGKVWSMVPAPSIGKGGTGLASVAATSRGDLWAAGTASAGPIGAYSERPIIMRWSGSAWKILRLPAQFAGLFIQLDCLTARNPDDVWVGGVAATPKDSGPLIGHWDGSSWHVYRRADIGLAGLRVGDSVEAISAPAADDVWAVLDNSYGVPSADGSVARTEPVLLHWDGTRWSRSAAAPYQKP
jgi:hypothetical protein